jgi:hypothetical protein
MRQAECVSLYLSLSKTRNEHRAHSLFCDSMRLGRGDLMSDGVWGVRLGGALWAGASGAGGCAWRRWPAEGPLIVSSTRLRRARPRRGRSPASSARKPCSLPTRRAEGGLRRADGGPGRVGGCRRLCQHRRVAAFLRWSSVPAPASHRGSLPKYLYISTRRLQSIPCDPHATHAAPHASAYGRTVRLWAGTRTRMPAHAHAHTDPLARHPSMRVRARPPPHSVARVCCMGAGA